MSYHDLPRWVRLVLDGLKYLAILVLTIAGMLFLSQSWFSYTDRLETQREQHIHQIIGRPYVHHGDKIEAATARPGDVIYVHNEYIRESRCAMSVANLLIGTGERQNIVHHWSTFQNWLPAGTFVADEIFVVPTWMPAGTYRIVKRTVADCEGRRVFFVNFDLPVAIAPGKITAGAEPQAAP